MTTEVYRGDCLEVMQGFESERIDLIYLDPPFFTQKVHRLKTKDRQRQFSFEDLWASYTDYAEFLYARLREMWRVLAPTGSLFFHCDHSAAHIVRALLDEIFGADMFRAEIIWTYRRWSNARKGLLPAHQTIYYYSKSDEYTFNTFYEAYSTSTNVDQILQRRKRNEQGKSVYDIRENGTAVPNGGKKGVPLNDVWDIPYLNPKAKERVGYPTQKPVLLLERIIKIASNEGDWILDPFCGSGTTLVAAALLNRNAIGIDSSADAIELTQTRLKALVKTESNLLEKGRNAYKGDNEEALALLQGLDYAPVHRNEGIDAILKDDLDGCPIPVRVQRSDETIFEAATRLYQAAKTKSAAVMVLIVTHKGGYLQLGQDLPLGVVVVESPAVLVSELLSREKANKR